MVDIISLPFSIVVKDAAALDAALPEAAAEPDAALPEVLPLPLPQAARDSDIRTARNRVNNFFMILLFLFTKLELPPKTEAFGFYCGETVSMNMPYHSMTMNKCQYFFK